MFTDKKLWIAKSNKDLYLYPSMGEDFFTLNPGFIHISRHVQGACSKKLCFYKASLGRKLFKHCLRFAHIGKGPVKISAEIGNLCKIEYLVSCNLCAVIGFKQTIVVSVGAMKASVDKNMEILYDYSAKC